MYFNYQPWREENFTYYDDYIWDLADDIYFNTHQREFREHYKRRTEELEKCRRGDLNAIKRSEECRNNKYREVVKRVKYEAECRKKDAENFTQQITNLQNSLTRSQQTIQQLQQTNQQQQQLIHQLQQQIQQLQQQIVSNKETSLDSDKRTTK